MGSPRPTRTVLGPGLLERSVPVFDVDAAGAEAAGTPARRCEVRLLNVTRDGAGERPPSAGVSAVLVLRALTPSRVLSCLRAVTDGGASLPPELLCQMLPERREGAVLAGERLTGREFDVLRLLADGDSTRDIAERLCYSERTVKNIVHDLLAKLNCRTRAHAVALATRHGVI